MKLPAGITGVTVSASVLLCVNAPFVPSICKTYVPGVTASPTLNESNVEFVPPLVSATGFCANDGTTPAGTVVALTDNVTGEPSGPSEPTWILVEPELP